MYRAAYDLKEFYLTPQGRVVRRVLQKRISEFWPETNNMRIMGCGYAVPYLREFFDSAERVIALSPAGQGTHFWPQKLPEEKNLTFLSEEGEIPIENASIDRILMVHNMEFSEMLGTYMDEIWRILKSNGRLLIIVPNRAGFWARADETPFGQGTPYSAGQVAHFLREHNFTHERTEEALFVPPHAGRFFLRSAPIFEKYGRMFAPLIAGVHMVEAGKQVFATLDKGTRAKVTVRGRGILPKPAVG